MPDFLYVSNTFVPYNCGLEEADVVFLGVPFSSTSISDSSNFGPVVVRESLKLIEGFDAKIGKDVFQKKICDLGNLETVPGSHELTSERIKETIKEIRKINSKAFLVLIGGEHLVTLPVVEELMPKTIVQLDAHMDLRKDYLGNEFSHTTWAYHAKKRLDCKIIQVGTRDFCQEEVKNSAEMGIAQGFETLEKVSGPAYLTIDMDVFDPCYVETGLPVSNGMSPREVFDIIEKLKGKELIGMDITEISSRELPSKTGFLAAEIIKKVLSHI